jgi:DNA-binding MarR family transcriptional regulator
MNEILADLLRKVSTAFQVHLNRMSAMEELGLTPYQAQLLSVIGRYPTISQLSLATSTERDKAQVARAIKELEKRGFVVRSSHETDWRTQCLSLTDAGTRAAIPIETQRAELITQAFRDCSAAEQENLRQALEKIIDSIS